MDKSLNSKTIPKSLVASVKSRFFGQYFEQIVAKETKYPNSPTINTTTVFLINALSNYHLELKPLSKITDEDAEHIMQLEAFIDGFLSDDFLNFLIDLKKGHCNKFEVVDYLRSKGYALPFMNYSVDDLVSFGWVQLL